MEEKELIRGKSNRNIGFVIISIIIAILLLSFVFIKLNDYGIFDANHVMSELMTYLSYSFNLHLRILIIISVCCIFFAIVLFILSKSEIIVTDKRIYGTARGKKVNIPLTSVKSAGTSAFNGITVFSPSKTSFLGITNRDDVYNTITTLIINKNTES